MPTSSSRPSSTWRTKSRSWSRSARAATKQPSRRRSARPARLAAAVIRTSAKSSNNERSSGGSPAPAGLSSFSSRHDLPADLLRPPSARLRGRRERAGRSARRLPREGGRLHRLPYGAKARRDSLRRRPGADHAIRDVLRNEHHARSEERHWRLDRSGFLPRDAERDAPGRVALLSRLPLSFLHEDHGQRPSRSVGLLALAPAEHAREPSARTALPVPLSHPRVPMEVALLHARTVRRRGGRYGSSQSRRLPRASSGTLRRVPYAAQLLRRLEEGSPARRREGTGRQECPEPHPDAPREVERRGLEGPLDLGDLPRR